MQGVEYLLKPRTTPVIDLGCSFTSLGSSPRFDASLSNNSGKAQGELRVSLSQVGSLV
jgi:hypothetical protein